MAESEPSYIDYETFLDPSFSPTSFANSLVTSTNNPSDSPLDLSTPLSRVLFDVQEIDTHIHNLTTKSALPLLAHTRDQADSGQRVLRAVEAQVSALTEGYERLEKDVLRRWGAAEEVRGAAERSWATVKLARAVGRCLVLGRQLEGQLLELSGHGSDAVGSISPTTGVREDHRALVRASHTLLMLRRMFASTADGEEGCGLDRVKVIRMLRSELVTPAENSVRSRAQQIINRFSTSALLADSGGGESLSGSRQQASTYAQQEEAKSRITSAITALYLLSPTPQTTVSATNFQPELLLATLKGYIQTSLSTSLQALSRGLSMLSTLERALLEVSTRCQHIVVLGHFLETSKLPAHPFLSYNTPDDQDGNDAHESKRFTARSKNNNLLQPLLYSLDTPSLPSYFWRSLASSLFPRVQEIVGRGGAPGRALRGNRDRVREELRQCVLRGSQLPSGALSRLGVPTAANAPIVVGSWEREAAVMVSSVMNALSR